DVNLSGAQASNSSFSFGLGNSYFTNDGGAATFNFGGSRPAKGDEVANSITETPVTTNPLSSANIFVDPINPNTGLPNAGINSNPTQPGVTTFTPGTAGTSRTSAVPTAIDPNTGLPTSYELQTTTTPGTPSTVTYGLPTLYQFPKKFLASLTAQVTSGNAKILTDPTLIVQEGQEAVVRLFTEVYAGLKTTSQSTATTSFSSSEPIIKEAGLSLAVKVERIDDNGFVSLSVAPTVSGVGGTASGGDRNGTITLLSARTLTSGQLRLRDGQTLILSGIIQDSDRTEVSKLPILGDIPLLGALFRKSSRTNERREVIVLLTPQIMDDSERSSYGYNYTPSPQIRQVLERRGVRVQPR
ncbi:MAG: type II and III secretion system protein, partial [Anabaena sp. CoA2_C59]|nr:type II and III secretion system protein [Anabaena sp. CoA2_C59]